MQSKNKINRTASTLRNSILFKILFATLLLPLLSYSQATRIDIGEYETERPDDPYLPNAYDNKKLSPAYRYNNHSRLKAGGSVIITHQVNVDSASQQNILSDAANEPSIAVNPLNENEIVIGWRQFDNVLSNFRQAGWAYSSDGGQTWTFPGTLNPGKFQSDPVLDYDNSGNFYYNSLESTTSGGLPCYIYKSSNGGISWNTGVDIGGGDKQWMTIDRSGGMGEGNIYSSWAPNFSDCPSGFFTRSTDGGSSYDPCTMIPDDPSWGTLAVGNSGELYVCGRSPLTSAVKVAKSTDAQDSTQVVTWTTVSTANLSGFITAGSQINPEGLTGQVYIDVDRSNGPGQGNVYVLASVKPYTGPDLGDVKFNKSIDGGVTWNNPPVKINDDTDTTNIQWFGTMSVAPNGRIDVIWLDTRDNPGSDSSALYYSYSIDQGNTWSVNEKLSDSFDPHTGYPNQQKMGDYFDMISNNTGVHLAWTNTLNGEQDVYYSFITPQTSIGIGEVPGNLNVTVHPNPTSGLLEISCSDNKIRIEIFTTVGKKVFSTSVFSTRHVIDLSSHSAGIYSLKLISDDGRETIKKIIRK